MKPMQAMSWFIIILMLLSTVGFVVVYVQNQSKAQPTKEETGPIKTPVILNFRSENVESKIVEIFHSALITGIAQEAEITKIEQEIFENLKGVNFQRSFYKQEQETQIGLGLRYVAEISYDKSLTANNVYEILNNAETLSNVEVIPVGLVTLPKTMTFENKDLELTKEYTFKDPMSKAYLSKDTIKGDEVTIALDVEFSDDTLTSIIAYEMSNMTMQINQFELEKEFPIFELGQKLRLQGTYPYGSSLTKEKIQEDLTQIQGIDSVEVKVQKPLANQKIVFEEGYENKKEDLNAIFNETPGILRVTLNENDLALDFNSSVDYDVFLKQIEDILKTQGITKQEYELNPLENDIITYIEYSGEKDSIINKLEEYTDTKYIEAETSREAIIKTETITNPENEQEYTLPQGEFQAFVQPKLEKDQTVKLQISAIYQRNEILMVNANQTE